MPVTLLAAGGREIDTGAETRALVEDVCVAVRPGDARRSSSTTSRGPGRARRSGPGLRYLGMPLGYELTTLVHGIVEAGRAEPALSSRLASSGSPRSSGTSTIDVFVTPT